MLRERTNLAGELRFACYMRMSCRSQNPRSPEQQLDAILAAVRRHKRAWRHVASYRDDALSGRMISNRPGLQRLLQDIYDRAINVDAILVDTYERWGRADAMEDLTWRLWRRHRVLLLTADSGFSDPTTEAGKALAFLEHVRATSAAVVRSHEVRRGKADTARQKHWPGAKPPFGYRICVHRSDDPRAPRFRYRTLEVDPETAWIVRRVFASVSQQGAGSRRIAHELNQDPSVPDRFKPFGLGRIRYWLKNRIYCGELEWGKSTTDIVNDQPIAMPTPSEDRVRVQEFCPPLVDQDTWDQVQALQAARAILSASTGTRGGGAAPCASVARPLNGLVRCAKCGRAMSLTSSSTSQNQRRRYYLCRAWHDGDDCSNRRRVRQDLLWNEVSSRLRRLLSLGESGAAAPRSLPDWFDSAAEEVRVEYALQPARSAHTTGISEQRLRDLQSRMNAWVVSLSQPTLPLALRRRLDTEYAAAEAEAKQLRLELARLPGDEQALQATLDRHAAMQAWCRLHSLLAGENIPGLCLELFRYIDRIEVGDDGQIKLRLFRLGLFANASDLLRGARRTPSSAQVTEDSGASGTCRWRSSKAATKLLRSMRVKSDPQTEPPPAAAAFHPGRFGGLEDRWFHVEDFRMTGRKDWYRDYSTAVAAKRAEDPQRWTTQQLSEHFQVSRARIANALHFAGHGRVPPRNGCAAPERVHINGEEWRRRRRMSGLTQQLCAAAAGCSVETYRRRETGACTMEQPERVTKLARALGCEVKDLLR